MNYFPSPRGPAPNASQITILSADIIPHLTSSALTAS